MRYARGRMPRRTTRPIALSIAALAGVELVAAVGLVALEARLADGAWASAALALCDLTVVVAFVLRVLLRLHQGLAALALPRRVATLVAALVAALFVSVRLAAVVVLIHDVFAMAGWFRRVRPAERALLGVGHRPARSLVLSFISLIGVGTVLLSFPAAWASEPVPLVDALFTAVSAVCVTGLTTVDTAVVWSTFGKGVIAALIQLGGLGIMAVAAAMTMGLGRGLGVRDRALVEGALAEADAVEIKALLKSLVLSTLAIEALGALALFARFSEMMPARQAVAYSLFHAVSAFCNAGFSLYSDNLVRFADDPLVNGIVAGLITCGGLGFGVLVALTRWVRTGGRQALPEHAKLVLMSSAALVWVGGLFYFFFEYDHSLASLDLGGKTLGALFQSVTARTAGFNTVPLDALHPLTTLLLIGLMFIGASPGSCGGGIKTTTAAVVALAVRAYILERGDVELYGRRLPDVTVLRALALTGGAVVSFTLALGLLLVTESQPFLSLAFETASALGTVGLTLGVTPNLTISGRLIVAALMFVGRVGALTAVAAMASRQSAPARIRLPLGKILLG